MTKKFWMIALTFAIPWTILMVIYSAVVLGGFSIIMLVFTLIGGFVAGLFFAIVMQYVAKTLIQKITIETSDDEVLIKEGGANHFRGKEGVGGKLVLTDKRLIFKSHNLNIQNHQQEFNLEAIHQVQATRSLGILENGMTLELITNEKHKFIVDDATDWINKITSQRRLDKGVDPRL